MKYCKNYQNEQRHEVSKGCQKMELIDLLHKALPQNLNFKTDSIEQSNTEKCNKTRNACKRKLSQFDRGLASKETYVSVSFIDQRPILLFKDQEKVKEVGSYHI